MTKVQTFSFHLNTFWFHVTMDGRVGVDQHGDKWFLKGDKLYSEFSNRIVSLKNCLS